jgi:hypothetical protein
MKSFNSIRSLGLWALLAAMGFMLALSGCMGSPGKSAREIHRDHINTVSTDWLMLQKDIDEFLFLDNPTRLSDSLSR